jgi:hypothetical protein
MFGCVTPGGGLEVGRAKQALLAWWHLVTIAIVLLMVGAAPVSAIEQAFGKVQAADQIYDGFKGNQGIRTNPATVGGEGWAHPTQVDVGPSGGDFVAVGTFMGNGPDGTFCDDDYDPGWTVYVDKVIGGVYGCTDYSPDAFGAGSNPSFEISYKFCVAVQANRWVLTFAGVQRTCIFSASSGGQAFAAGLETTGTITDRNIDVKYTNLYKSLIGSSAWTQAGNTAVHAFASPNYTYQYVSLFAFNTYLAPLD